MTLIELMTVILILGILATLGAQSFISQTGKSHDSVAKSHVASAQKAAETLASDNNGEYTEVSAAAIIDVEPTLSNATGLSTSGDADTYRVSATSDSSAGTVFKLERKADGTIERTCDKPGVGGCRASGTW